jgi:hypothetical protein
MWSILYDALIFGLVVVAGFYFIPKNWFKWFKNTGILVDFLGFQRMCSNLFIKETYYLHALSFICKVRPMGLRFLQDFSILLLDQ